MAERPRASPESSAAQLNQVLARGDPAKLLVALRQQTEALGGIGGLAERTGFNRTQLYRTLSNRGNPDVRRLSAILAAMGLRLAVQPMPRRRTRTARHA